MCVCLTTWPKTSPHAQTPATHKHVYAHVCVVGMLTAGDAKLLFALFLCAAAAENRSSLTHDASFVCLVSVCCYRLVNLHTICVRMLRRRHRNRRRRAIDRHRRSIDRIILRSHICMLRTCEFIRRTTADRTTNMRHISHLRRSSCGNCILTTCVCVCGALIAVPHTNTHTHFVRLPCECEYD